MALLTAAQIGALERLVQAHVSGFAVEAFGPAAVDEATLADLLLRGIIDQATIAKLRVDALSDAFHSGIVVQRLAQLGTEADAWAPADLEAWLSKNPVPLEPTAQHALEYARRSAGLYCKGLGNRLASEAGAVAFEEDEALRRQRLVDVSDVVSEGIQERQSVAKVRSELGHRTGDWARNLDRIAATELQNAHNEGTVHAIANDFGADARVAKLPNTDACADCERLYLEDGRPRMFTVAELVANGSNFGKKRVDWLAVVDCTHPWCACTLVHVPDGLAFDADWRLVPEGE